MSQTLSSMSHTYFSELSPLSLFQCYKTALKVKVIQSCPTLCDPMNFIVHGILQARILEWVAFPFSRGSSQPRDWTQVSCIAGEFFTSWATREAQLLLWSLKLKMISILKTETWPPTVAKIAGRNINNLRHADDTTLMAESEELKSLDESERGERKSWLKTQHSEN